MYARSAAFDAAIRNSHTALFRADVLSAGAVVQSGLAVSTGKVNVDGTAAVRRRGDLSVIDTTGLLAPSVATDILSPYGHEIRVYRGIRLTTGDELIPVATLRISSAQSVGGIVKITGYDRSRSVSRCRFETPYVIAAGTSYVTAIQALISFCLPGITFSFTDTGHTTQLVVFAQSADPWASAQSLASSIGCELFFDPLGVCVLRQVVNPATAPVAWDYSDGAGSMLIDATSTMTDDPGYNGMVVDGEAPGSTPVHSVVYDTDPTSPTYSAGPYGKVPEFYRSTMIATQAQADETAKSLMLLNRGGTEQVTFNGMVHPALEYGDLLPIRSDIERINSQYLLESFSVPLDVSSTMSATTRKRRSLA